MQSADCLTRADRGKKASPMTFERYRQRLGKRLIERRHEAGLTQEELAAQAGLTRQHLRLLEIGASNPKLSTLLALADAFGLTVSQLLEL